MTSRVRRRWTSNQALQREEREPEWWRKTWRILTSSTSLCPDNLRLKSCRSRTLKAMFSSIISVISATFSLYSMCAITAKHAKTLTFVKSATKTAILFTKIMHSTWLMEGSFAKRLWSDFCKQGIPTYVWLATPKKTSRRPSSPLFVRVIIKSQCTSSHSYCLNDMM